MSLIQSVVQLQGGKQGKTVYNANLGTNRKVVATVTLPTRPERKMASHNTLLISTKPLTVAFGQRSSHLSLHASTTVLFSVCQKQPAAPLTAFVIFFPTSQKHIYKSCIESRVPPVLVRL